MMTRSRKLRQKRRRSRVATSMRVARRGGAPLVSRASVTADTFGPNNDELRFAFVAWSAGPLMNSVTTTIKAYELSQVITAGTDITNRTGRSIILEGISLRGTLIGGQSNLNTDDEYNVFRLSVLMGSPFLPAITAAGYNLNQPLDRRTYPGLQKVLYDHTWVLKSPGRDSIGYMPSGLQLNRYIPVHVPIDFYATGSGFTSLNGIWVVAVSDSVLAPSPGFVNGGVTLNFLDK